MNKRKIYGKLILDLVLLVLLALMISMHFHETGCLVLCGPFLIHKALNLKWIRSVTAGFFQRKARLNASRVLWSLEDTGRNNISTQRIPE